MCDADIDKQCSVFALSSKLDQNNSEKYNCIKKSNYGSDQIKIVNPKSDEHNLIAGYKYEYQNEDQFYWSTTFELK